MRERDRISAMAYHAELQALEEAAREERERPIREGEAALNKTYLELRDVEIEAIKTRKDDAVYISPSTQGIVLTVEQANTNNLAAANAFVDQCADYREHYKTNENRDAILAYLVDRNLVKIWDVAILQAAFEKLKSLGLLTPIPVPVAPAPVPVRRTPAVEPEAPKGPQMFAGVDITTGLDKSYSAREVNAMNGDTYRRAFLVSSESLRLPTVGPGSGRR
jgi:hypothetical protein